MQEDKLKQQIDFIIEIDNIKYINRKTKLFNNSRYENVAEHSWHLAMMALILSEYSNNEIDLLKVIKMVLIHDIVEIDSGDIFFYDNIKSHKNTYNELKAANRIFGILPKEQSNYLINLWIEFEKGNSKEAQFAKAMDCFEPILQNTTNKGGAWKEFDINLNTVLEKNSPINKGSTTIWDYTKKLIKKTFKMIHIRNL